MKFGRPKAAEKRAVEFSSFGGIDLSSAPSDISKRRSSSAPNMMPDSIGNPIKRTGFCFEQNFGGRINGAFQLGEHEVIHSGKNLFLDGKKIWSGMNDGISTGQIIGDRLYIFDGQEALVCDGEDVWPLGDSAYVPTVLISKNADECERETAFAGDGESTEFALEHRPEEILSVTIGGEEKNYSLAEEKIVFETAPEEGEEIRIRARYKSEPGGSINEELNLISPRWRESFLCDTGTERKFTLSKDRLSKGKVRAFVMNEEGEWEEKIEGTDFSVDREKGKITFNEAVPKAPVIGEDNLIIEAMKHFEGYEDRINLCRRSFAYDFGGGANRIFLCGNPNEKQRDFWCAAGDPTYWPDNYYSELGHSGTEIIGYSVVGGMLGAHLKPAPDGRSIALRSFALDEKGNASLPVEKYLLGEEAVCPGSFVYMEKEPLFLTERGVYAITPEDISGEKYTQNRSYYINRALCEENLAEAFCGKWKQFYVISAGGKLYLLDTSQKSYEKGEPLSSFQYECYLWTGIDARVLWEKDGALYFGDSEGNVCRFMEDRDAALSYEDYHRDGNRAIEAYWTIPDFSGDVFWKNKTIRTVALSLAPYPRNKVCLEKCVDGRWENIREWEDKISFFAWNAIDWSRFTWSGNRNYRTVTAKVKIKKFDKIGFRISSREKNRAFGLYGFSVEFTESGRYKK